MSEPRSVTSNLETRLQELIATWRRFELNDGYNFSERNLGKEEAHVDCADDLERLLKESPVETISQPWPRRGDICEKCGGVWIASGRFHIEHTCLLSEQAPPAQETSPPREPTAFQNFVASLPENGKKDPL